MTYENSGTNYNWFSDIIREKELRGMKPEHISPQIIQDGNLYRKYL